MLILNKEKEQDLLNKYGFIENYNIHNHGYYTNDTHFTIYGIKCKQSLQVNFTNSRKNLDLLYDLIKDDIIIKVPELTKKEKIKKKIIQLENQIKELQSKLEE